MFEACRLIRTRVAALVVLGLAVTGPTSAQEPPDLSGVWRLGEKAREELKATVEAAVGPEKTQGGGSSRARFTLLSRGSSEIDRIQLRNFLMKQVSGFEDLEIEQTAEEITLARGNDSLRLFSFARERTRQTELGGKTKVRASWKDGQLRLEENGDGPVRVDVERAAGTKCGRCWTFSEKVGTLSPPEVCERCAEVLARQ